MATTRRKTKEPEGALDPSAVITFVDISGAKKAQEELRERKSHFRQLAESLPRPVWMCLPDCRCDYLSPQWVEFTGVPEAQQLGLGWLDQVQADDRSALMTAWNTAAAAREPFKVEFRIRHHSGDHHWFDMRATALRDAASRIVKWFGMNIDITGREPQDRAGQGGEETP
jgi:two-component system CheB/CheR fusion protein